jgi:DNA-binding CsgD family transcriptional regulator
MYALASDALDKVGIATFVVSNDRTVAFANQALISLAAMHDGLELSQDGLSLHHANEDAELQRMLETWCRAPTQMERSCLAVTRPSGRRPYNIVFRPMVPHAHARATEVRLLMICVYDPMRLERLQVDPIMELFSLSRSEARLATALVAKGTLQAAAVHCSITEGSARQYLKRIFHKTHTNGQVELVALILASVPV